MSSSADTKPQFECADCGAVIYQEHINRHLAGRWAGRLLCPHCLTENLEWVEVSGKGKLAAFTSIYIAPTFMIEQGFDRNNPYLTGIVELDEGRKISARLLGFDAAQPEHAKIGTPLSVTFLEHGEGDEKKTALAFQVA